MMFAVFEDGSRQYRVSEGERVTVDYRQAEKGTKLEFPRVLLYQSGDDLRIGQPLVEGARILGEVVDQTSTKVYVQKYRRRKHYRRLRGHRQPFTEVQIRYILLPGMEPPAPPPENQAPAPQPSPSETAATSPPAGETPASPPTPAP
jgi:large subunit ribosomal protein L21